MITPPKMTQSFYAVLLEKPMAQKVVKLMSASSSNDIVQVLITSLDIESDIVATNELDTAARGLLLGQEFDHVMKFNPLYLPISGEELSTKLEIDRDGDLTGIDGFQNPFVCVRLDFSITDYPDVISSSVNFKQFQLPKMIELLENQVPIS